MAVAVLLLGAWSLWFTRSRIPVYETSDSARLETAAVVHPVTAPVDGRISVTNLAVGRQVKQGDVLAELDAVPERAATEESRAKQASLTARIDALRATLTAEREGLAAHAAAARIATDAALAQAREAQAYALLAESEANYLATVRAAGGAAQIEVDRARADAEAKRASAEALALAAERAAAEGKVQADDRHTRIADLEQRVADARGELAIETARADYDNELRTIRAPVDGSIGDSANLTVGAFVEAGDVFGSVIPDGALRAVAYFPAASLGRVRAGQPARIRLTGFPWPAFARLGGGVASVALEPRDGRVRVELTMTDAPLGAIPVEHGLPGEVEVEVEHASPLALVLRAAGGRLAARPIAALDAGKTP